MGFVDVRAVEVRCDTCGRVAVGDDGARLFTGRRSAREILAGHRWVFTADRITCDGCIQKAACTLVGHTWADWIDRVFDGYVGRTRTCVMCEDTEAEPPLPAHAGDGGP